MIYTNLTRKALMLSFDKHKEQLDKSGVPYIYHPFTVAYVMETEEAVCVALLHDILEDTDTSEKELYNLGFTKEIIEAIKIMTHQDGEDYFDYINRVKENPISKVVKIADLKHNSDLSRLKEITQKDLDRIEKYQKALTILTN